MVPLTTTFLTDPEAEVPAHAASFVQAALDLAASDIPAVEIAGIVEIVAEQQPQYFLS
jgi:hypothetical protein